MADIKQKRVRFTQKELELISEMIGIANAGDLNEGDYQGWVDEGKDNTLDSLSSKISILLQKGTQ